MIRILIVEDSPTAANLISELLSTDPEIQIVGISKNGKEAIEMAQRLKPDLITMDIEMPILNGVEATKQIMAYSPTPILILSSAAFQGKKMELVFQALSYGAMEVMEKDIFTQDQVDEKNKLKLFQKIKLLHKVQAVTHLLGKIEHQKIEKKFKTYPKTENKKIVGIVASTGGPQALLEVLRRVPKTFPVPILLVQHISAGFTEGLAEWLNDLVPLEVKVAKSGEFPKSGKVYVAPSNVQLKILPGGELDCTDTMIVDGECPSGTALLSSIAEVYRKDSLGIVLTGMGKDGASGLKKIYDRNGFTIAQDESSSVVYGMPKAAVELGAVQEILPLEKIADRILEWGGKSIL